MKSLADLKAIREKSKQQVEMRRDQEGYRVVVGMATCGIAAGARPVMSAIVDKVQKENLENVTVTQTGCIGFCRLEPIVEIYNPNGDKVTYVNVDTDKAVEIVDQHVKRGQIIDKYTIGNAKKEDK